ncbi:MAG TPA: hypothetical protein VEG34_16230, partial [Thermoanaerobaculia bacterium]|nr:hypothetical protein [Thermoanaerobaculia bacterium]
LRHVTAHRPEAADEVASVPPHPIVPPAPEAPAETTPAAETAATTETPVSDAAVRAATGRGWEEWFAWLDEAGAARLPHGDIAKMVHAAGVPGWWSQSVAVGYERARGLRAKHQKADGFSASASKTVAVPLADLYAACADDASRARWLVPPPGTTYRVRGITQDKSVRLVWSDGTAVTIGVYAKGEGKSLVGLEHSKLPDAEAVTRLKAFWKESLERLAAQLAG